jgi:gas vesicle protein
MQTVNSTGKVIGALFLGTLVGATIGVLFAPNKCSKTRRRLISGAKNWAEDLQEKMKEEATALRKKAEELESLAEEKMADMTASAKLKVEQLLNHS